MGIRSLLTSLDDSRIERNLDPSNIKSGVKVGRVVGILQEGMKPGSTVAFNAGNSGGSMTSYTKLRGILVNQAGTYRVSFELRTDQAGISVSAYFAINNIQIGEVRTTSSTTPILYTQDIVLKAGDVVSVYGKATSPAFMTMSQFMVSIDFGTYSNA